MSSSLGLQKKHVGAFTGLVACASLIALVEKREIKGVCAAFAIVLLCHLLDNMHSLILDRFEGRYALFVKAGAILLGFVMVALLLWAVLPVGVVAILMAIIFVTSLAVGGVRRLR